MLLVIKYVIESRSSDCLFDGSNQASFCLFSFFPQDKYSTNLTINENSKDFVHGTRTHGGGMVGTAESTELWRHPSAQILLFGRIKSIQTVLLPLPTISVTRWFDYMFNIWPFTPISICPKA